MLALEECEIRRGRFYTSIEVAAWLRHPPKWFYVNRPALHRQGFPPPAVAVGQPRWRGDDLLDWDARRAVGECGDPGGSVVNLAEIARQRGAFLLSGKRRAS